MAKRAFRTSYTAHVFEKINIFLVSSNRIVKPEFGVSPPVLVLSKVFARLWEYLQSDSLH
jgi:hypothetical protein